VEDVPVSVDVVAVLVVGVVADLLVEVLVLEVVVVGVVFVLVVVEELVVGVVVVEVLVVALLQSFAASSPTVLAPRARLSRIVELTVGGRFWTSLLNVSAALVAVSHCPLCTADATRASSLVRLPA
jgi:hypothetical protein